MGTTTAWAPPPSALPLTPACTIDACLPIFSDRSAYIACSDPEAHAGAGAGARPAPFDFVQHMLLCLERDAARLVGISVEMWLVVIVWVLLSGIGSECAASLRRAPPPLLFQGGKTDTQTC
jgi:hypothetical protein